MTAARGPGETGVQALHLLHRALGRLTRRRWRIVPYRFFAQPLGAPGGAVLRDDPRTVIRQVGAGDPLVAAFPRPGAVNARRFAAGHRCHAAVVNGEFAGHIWTAASGYEEDEVRCRYEFARPARGCWDFDVYVAPKWRLGRTMARLWQAVDRNRAGEGVAWSFSRISMFNAESLGAHARLGARPVGWAIFLVAGSWQWAVTSGSPRLHFCASHERRPVLTLPEPA
ncbi:hypothetical protein [Pseudorhodoferax sp.]|uniref:hypothetical protein n=1 Tax=Pseudorhodoferax sp. TaxID=1993553 RepID=UPI002DD67976|nr:hypothetical protein [Pseudorhodoferax sp.]